MRNFFIMLTAVMLATVNGHAQTVYHWKGGYTSSWHIATNWTGDAVPGANDTANIGVPGAGVILQSPATVHSLLMSNNVTMVFSNWSTVLNAVNVEILSNATVTCHGPFRNNENPNRVNFAANNFFLSAGAQINVDGRGYSGGTNSTVGHGPGGGTNGAGGSYGGRGGFGYAHAGATYGDKTAPTEPGSGSGGTASYSGGPGGGAVRISASGKVVINGIITARGMQGYYNQAGAGSGGGIYITCASFTGTNGAITAIGGKPTDIGGAGSYNGGGGGGRIAISGSAAPEYTGAITLSAYPGIGGRLAGNGEPGFPGTIYVSDVNILPETWPNSSGGVLSAPEPWTPSNLFAQNAIIALDDGYSINVSGNAVFSSTNQITIGALDRFYYYHRPNGLYLQPNSSFKSEGNLSLNNVNLVIYGSANSGNTNITKLDVGGNFDMRNDLTPTNLASVFVISDGTNSFFPEYDSQINVHGTATIRENVWIHPYSNVTNGGSVLFRFGNLIISSNAGFRADAVTQNRSFGTPNYWFYIGGYGGPIAGIAADGHGPGGGTRSSVYGGGGYGGRGAPSTTVGGLTYGSSNAPVYPGSGGAANAGAGGPGNFGGGLVRIEVQNTLSMLQGSLISANGQSSTHGNHAGGSGGGIYLRCRELIAEAGSFLSATGGSHNAGFPANTEAGGGGRIAAWSISNNFAATVTVAPGTSSSSLTDAEPGTFVLGTFPYVLASITNLSMIAQSNRTEEATFEIWNAAAGGNPAYYSFDFFDVPTLVFTPSNGMLSAQQTNTISVSCIAGHSHDGLYYGTLRIMATNSTMNDMEPYNIDIATEIEVVPPPRGSFIMLK